MARVQLHVDDPANRMTLHAMLRAAGHTIVDALPDVAISDSMNIAVELARTLPVLVLTSAAQIRDAVSAMQHGVFGYIFVPFQPGEADLMVRRALAVPVTPLPADTRPLVEVEADHMLNVVRQCKGNRAKAARILGVGRNTLWRKLKEIEARGANTGA